MKRRILTGILGAVYVAVLALLFLTFLRTRTADASAADTVRCIVLGVAAMLDLWLYVGVKDRDCDKSGEQSGEGSPDGETAAAPETEESAKPEDIRNRAAFAEAARPYGLTDRELEVAGLLYLGCTNRQISEELFIAETTVKKHATHIYEKMQVAGKKELREKINSSRRQTDRLS